MECRSSVGGTSVNCQWNVGQVLVIMMLYFRGLVKQALISVCNAKNMVQNLHFRKETCCIINLLLDILVYTALVSDAMGLQKYSKTHKNIYMLFAGWKVHWWNICQVEYRSVQGRGHMSVKCQFLWNIESVPWPVGRYRRILPGGMSWST